MNITLSENVRRMRREKGVTQEQVAETLGVSVTAVSKWERGESYPDITLLFPLARYFGVTLDTLMGYDEEKIQAQIEDALEEFSRLYVADQAKAEEYAVRLYREFPDDPRILQIYLVHHLAGGLADNDPARLLANREEILSVCDRMDVICTDPLMRLNVLNIRAKLLHAQGQTDQALNIYRENFPDWFLTRDQKAEQLFAKDSPGFRDQLTRNLYVLSEFAVDKKLKSIWFCEPGTVTEKTERSLALADTFRDLAGKAGFEEAVLLEYGVCVWLGSSYLRRFDGPQADRIRAEQRRQEAAASCNALAEHSPLVRDYLRYRYGRERL